MASFDLPKEAAATTRTTIGPAGTNLPRKTLIRQHTAVSSMWKEWFGLEDFKEDDFLGGIEHLETTYTNQWRNYFNAAEQKQFSQLK